tara:strand:- start:2074 stop:3225 length:1152 start_codon:yes stop_codon:yes gene_type:complete
MNQLYKLLEKEVGKVQLMSLRHIPVPKDGDAQDALDMWEMEARERGVVFIDDSPENLKAPSSFNQFTSLDLTRTQEIQSRYNLAQQMKVECWELIGMSRQRMGSVAASETATATNTAMQQSYSQTEPLFIAHEYVMGQLYQGIIDASLYIESSKPQSTLSYITSEGESAFVQVNGSDLTLRDLKVFLTNRPEDTQMFNELRQLAQAIIQNGGTLYDIIELYSTKSMREMKKTFKDLRDRQVQQQEQQMQMQQQQQEQAGKIAQGQMQQTEQLAAQKQANENYQNELDRINKKEIAMINAMSKEGEATADLDNSGTPDSLEIEKIASQQSIAKSNYNSKMADINSKNTVAQQKLQIEREKIKLARDNQANDLAVAKMNAKGRSK